MPKYLLLKHYRGGPEPYRPFPPMDQWAPEDVEAHMAFLRHVSELLQENGEYVDGQALTPERTWVRYGGPDAAPGTTDGPLPETSDLVAGCERTTQAARRSKVLRSQCKGMVNNSHDAQCGAIAHIKGLDAKMARLQVRCTGINDNHIVATHCDFIIRCIRKKARNSFFNLTGGLNRGPGYGIRGRLANRLTGHSRLLRIRAYA